MIQSDSKLIGAFEYDQEKKELTVYFRGKADKKGNVYKYLNLDLVVYNQFKDSISKGRFFLQQIKGKYACIKIEPIIQETKIDDQKGE